LKILDDITSKGLSYISLIDEKIMDLKDTVEPVDIIKCNIIFFIFLYFIADAKES